MARKPASQKKPRLEVKVQRLPHADDLPLPAYQTQGSAGMDLLAAIGARTSVVLKPGSRALIPTGLVLELPPGTEGQVRPRSGLALRDGITLLNSPGTIDSDYRGEVGVILVNLGEAPFRIERGARIAQLVIQRVEQAALIEVRTTATTTRGKGGFGSTGVKSKAGKAKRKPTRSKLPVRTT